MLALSVSIASPCAVRACPIDQLTHLINEPITALRKTEVRATENRSTEGGTWHLYFRPDGRPHSLIRIDYGETGRRQIRASFVDSATFAIQVTTLKYAVPIDATRPMHVATKEIRGYYFCEKENLVYLPVQVDDSGSAVRALNEADSVKREIFEAPGIRGFLERLN